MKQLFENGLPVKCRDPYNQSCPGFRKEGGGWCMFVIGAFCGADREDFDAQKRETVQAEDNSAN